MAEDVLLLSQKSSSTLVELWEKVKKKGQLDL